METSTTSAAPAVLPKLPPLDYRIPRWAPEDLGPRPCPFCGGAERAGLAAPQSLTVMPWTHGPLQPRLENPVVAGRTTRRSV